MRTAVRSRPGNAVGALAAGIRLSGAAAALATSGRHSRHPPRPPPPLRSPATVWGAAPC